MPWRSPSLDGAMVAVGAATEPLSSNAFSPLARRRSMAGSMIGGTRGTQEMLDFCAEKSNEAYERVPASDVRYRFVIGTSTLAWIVVRSAPVDVR